MANTLGIPQFVEKIPYQEISDSPTERYYTDWKRYERRLNLPEATKLDDIQYGEDRCVINGNSPLATDCEGVAIDQWRIEELPVKERMAAYHVYRRPDGFEIIVKDGSNYALLLPGGEGYTGYTVRITVKPMARASLIIIDTALHEGLKTQYIDVHIGEQSHLEITHVVAHSEKTPVYTLVRAEGESGSRLTYRAGGRPGEMTRLRVDASLDKPYSRVDGVLGFSSSGVSIGDIIFNVAHTAENTVSLVSGMGIAREGSKLTMRGIARVSQEARSARTRVEMHVIVVGDKAKGRSVPMLEIYTGDVEEASHSASVTTMGENILFYAASRGLERRDLEALLERGVLERAGVIEILEGLAWA